MTTTTKARELAATALSHFWFKMFGTMGFTFVFFVVYLYLLKHPLFPTTTIPLTWLDQAVAFQPAALPAYLSLWLYVSLPPILMDTRLQIITYGFRIGAVCLFAFTIFLFWPNEVPAADIDWTEYPGIAFLKGMDAAGNACPSLHVATAVFSAFWLHWRLRYLGLGPAIQTMNIVWCATIAYSTIATRQHVAIDVGAGIALGLAGALLTGLKRHAAHTRDFAFARGGRGLSLR